MQVQRKRGNAMTEKQAHPELFSIGEVAARFGVSRDQAVYAVHAHRIEPTMVAGGRRLYDEATAEQIRSALRRIQANRQRREGGEACPR